MIERLIVSFANPNQSGTKAEWIKQVCFSRTQNTTSAQMVWERSNSERTTSRVQISWKQPVYWMWWEWKHVETREREGGGAPWGLLWRQPGTLLPAALRISFTVKRHRVRWVIKVRRSRWRAQKWMSHGGIVEVPSKRLTYSIKALMDAWASRCVEEELKLETETKNSCSQCLQRE